MHDRGSCGLHTSSPSPTFSAARPPVRGQTAPGPRACPQHCRPATPTFAAGFRRTLRRPYVTTPHPRRTARSAVESTQRTACRTARCTARRTARYAARSQASTNRHHMVPTTELFQNTIKDGLQPRIVQPQRAADMALTSTYLWGHLLEGVVSSQRFLRL